MATEKEILLIQRLLSEGTEQLSGEWWIDQDGDPTFADGDVGDYNHAMIAFESALGISLEDQDVPEMIPMEELSDEAIEYLTDIGADTKAVEFLKDGSDPREYAMAHMGWIRVLDNNFQAHHLTDDAMARIGDFLHEMLEDDSGDIYIEDLSEGKMWSVPAKIAMISGAKAEGVKRYSRSRFREEDVVRLAAMISEDLVPKVLMVLGEDDELAQVQKEYEQRFDLKNLPDLDNIDSSEIKQGLLYDKPGFSMRIRQEDTGEDVIYSLTCKFYKKSDESEVEITKEMFDKLWPETLPEKRMTKTRYFYDDNWVIDDISEPEEKIVAEIETDEENEDVEVPDEFDLK